MATYTSTPTASAQTTDYGGTTAWTDPTNALSEDGSKAYVEGASLTSHTLILYDFDFAIPGDEDVVGIEWRIRHDKDGAGWKDNLVALTLEASPFGGSSGNEAKAGIWPDDPTDETYGGPTYLNVTGGLGGNLRDDINNPNFGVVLQVIDEVGAMAPARANVDVVEVTIYTEPSTPPTFDPSENLTWNERAESDGEMLFDDDSEEMIPEGPAPRK